MLAPVRLNVTVFVYPVITFPLISYAVIVNVCPELVGNVGFAGVMSKYQNP